MGSMLELVEGLEEAIAGKNSEGGTRNEDLFSLGIGCRRNFGGRWSPL